MLIKKSTITDWDTFGCMLSSRKWSICLMLLNLNRIKTAYTVSILVPSLSYIFTQPAYVVIVAISLTHITDCSFHSGRSSQQSVYSIPKCWFKWQSAKQIQLARIDFLQPGSHLIHTLLEICAPPITRYNLNRLRMFSVFFVYSLDSKLRYKNI